MPIITKYLLIINKYFPFKENFFWRKIVIIPAQLS